VREVFGVRSQRVVVVGGGVIGVCCARALAGRGWSVRVFERGRVGGACSFGNSGFIAPGHGPLCEPGLFERAMASMVDPEASFHVVPTTDARTLEWLRRFRDACTEEHYSHCLHALASLGGDMVERFSDIVETERLACDFHPSGSDMACFSERTLREAREEVASLNALGFPAEALDAGAARERFPALDEGVVGGAALSAGASINPYAFVSRLAARLRERGACAIDEGTGVVSCDGGGVTLESGERVEADAVVLAAGMATPALASAMGCEIPMCNATGYHADVRAGGRVFDRPVVLADADVILTPMEDFVRVSGTVALGPGASALRERRRAVMVERSLRMAPALRGGEVISRWEGHRPAAPDGLPVIGAAARGEGVFVATAHARLGLSLAPATGEAIAAMVSGEAPAWDMTPFRVDRF